MLQHSIGCFRVINTLKLHPRRSLFYLLWRHLSGTIQSNTPFCRGPVWWIFCLSVHIRHFLTTRTHMGEKNGDLCYRCKFPAHLPLQFGRITICCEEKPTQTLKDPNVSSSRSRVSSCLCSHPCGEHNYGLKLETKLVNLFISACFMSPAAGEMKGLPQHRWCVCVCVWVCACMYE